MVVRKVLSVRIDSGGVARRHKYASRAMSSASIALPNIMESYSAHGKPFTSVWQVGLLPGADPDFYIQVIVYAFGPSQNNGNGGIIRMLLGTMDPQEAQAAQFNAMWQSPRNVGNLKMTAITGQNGVISFTSDSGAKGTLDMSNGAWNFSTP